MGKTKFRKEVCMWGEEVLASQGILAGQERVYPAQKTYIRYTSLVRSGCECGEKTKCPPSPIIPSPIIPFPHYHPPPLSISPIIPLPHYPFPHYPLPHYSPTSLSPSPIIPLPHYPFSHYSSPSLFPLPHCSSSSIMLPLPHYPPPPLMLEKGLKM